MTWYEVWISGRKILPIKVIRETAQYIWTASGRTKKSSEYSRYFKTREEAVEWLLGRMEKTISGAQQAVKFRENELARFKTQEGIL